MSLLTIAEVLCGEALVSPGGPVDRTTAVADEDELWQSAGEALVREPDHTGEHLVEQPVLV